MRPQPDAPTLRDWLAGQLRLRPAVATAAALMLGVAVHERLPHHPWFWLLAAVATLAAVSVWRGAGTRLLLLATVLCGVALGQVESFRFPRDHVAHFATPRQRLAQLELQLRYPPRIVGDAFSITGRRALPPKQVCVARATRVLTWSGWTEVSGEVLVQIDQPHPRLVVGQTIRVLGMLQRPSPAMNPGQFDWEDYYREQRVLCSIGIDHAENIRIVAESRPGAIASLRAEARRLLALGFEESRSLDHALLRALLLGDHDPELRDVQEQFRRTGTSHHLAISGMHVAVLGAVVLGICRLARLSPRSSAITVLGFVVAYGVLALPSPPVVRSVLLCAAFTIGALGRRTLDSLQLLSVSVIAMLVYHPLDLFNAGFQLSFGTVLGLILFTPPVTRWLLTDSPDVAVLRSFQRLTPRQRAWDVVKRGGVTTLAASGVAWVVSAPLLLIHFEQLNPYAIPGSVLLAPFVFAALVGGLLKLALTLLLPFGATTWANLAGLPIEAMRDIVDLLARLPGADVPLPAPPVAWIILFYLLLALPLLPVGSLLLRRGLRVLGPTGAGLALILPFAAGWRAPDASHPREDSVIVTLLAVGAGQCAVVAPPTGPLVLIDCGSGTLRDPLRRCIAPFVRHLGRTRIDRVILSHGDFDHVSSTAEVVQAYGVREVLTGSHFRRCAADNPPTAGLLSFLDDAGVPVTELVPGNRLHLGGGCAIEVLWPAPGATRLSSNDAGLVLRLNYAGRSILFPADLQVAGHEGLLAMDRAAVRARGLIAPHQGIFEDSTGELIRAVDPQFILASNDRTLTLKQLDFDRAVGSRPLRRTHRVGSLTVRITRSGELSIHEFQPDG